MSFVSLCYHLVYNLLLFNSFLRHGGFLEVRNSFVSKIKGKFYLFTKNMGEKTINEKTVKYSAAQQASYMLK